MTTRVRRRMGVEERRAQLIGVALELFSHRSPDDVSIDEIAAAAGDLASARLPLLPGQAQSVRGGAEASGRRTGLPLPGGPRRAPGGPADPGDAPLLRFRRGARPRVRRLDAGRSGRRFVDGRRLGRRGAPGGVRADHRASRCGVPARPAGARGAVVGVAGRVDGAALAGREACSACRAGVAAGARLRGAGGGERGVRPGDGRRHAAGLRAGAAWTARSASCWPGSPSWRPPHRPSRRSGCLSPCGRTRPGP